MASAVRCRSLPGMAKSARLELRVEEGLLGAIDAARGDVSRTRWVERAIERSLNFSPPPGPPSEMLDVEHLQRTGKARMLPLDPGAPSVDEAMVRARAKARQPAAPSRASARPVHAATCRCPVCRPVKG